MRLKIRQPRLGNAAMPSPEASSLLPYTDCDARSQGIAGWLDLARVVLLYMGLSTFIVVQPVHALQQMNK
jgi:hypothetical protein